jgi:thioredoxin 1
MIGTSQNFQSEVLNFQGVVVVDFWATWCGPCLMLSPIIDEIEKELLGNGLKPFRVVKVDVDAESTLASEYNINSIPAVIIFDKGKIKETIIGLRQKSDYLKALL